MLGKVGIYAGNFLPWDPNTVHTGPVILNTLSLEERFAFKSEQQLAEVNM